jgi:phospholipid transport system transporter-binding protein
MKGASDLGHGPSPNGEPSCGACAAENQHFAAGERWLLAGALTVDTAASVLESSRDAALPKSGIVDLSGLDAVDSAAVAVLLAWRRRAAVEGVKLSFIGTPKNLGALAELYGVEEFVRRPAPIAA